VGENNRWSYEHLPFSSSAAAAAAAAALSIMCPGAQAAQAGHSQQWVGVREQGFGTMVLPLPR
jgi:hypothetical protein